MRNTSIIDSWYELRHSRKNTGCSEEITEEIDGGKRTVTLFPSQAFLTYEARMRIIKEMQENPKKY